MQEKIQWLIKIKLCQYSLTQRNDTIMFHWKKLAQTGLDSPPPTLLKPLYFQRDWQAQVPPFLLAYWTAIAFQIWVFTCVDTSYVSQLICKAICSECSLRIYRKAIVLYYLLFLLFKNIWQLYILFSRMLFRIRVHMSLLCLLHTIERKRLLENGEKRGCANPAESFVL